MATRAKPKDLEEDLPVEAVTSLGDILFLAFPKPTYDALNTEAAKRGHTIAQALEIAIDDYLKRGKDG